MPEVKIILGTEYIDLPWNAPILLEAITDWEEVTDEELEYLQHNLYKITTWPTGLFPTILVKDIVPISIRIESIKNKIKEDLEHKKEKERRNKEAQEKRLATKQKNKEEKERKLLEQLKGKYENE